MYKASNPQKVGALCMVFVDTTDGEIAGSRFIRGVIVDVFQQIITVEVTHSTFFEFRKNDQLWFKRNQVWAYQEKPNYTQLSMF
jgi:hypothetical protein